MQTKGTSFFRKMQEKIDNLKQTLNQCEARDTISDYCSETDTEGGCASDNMLDAENDYGQAANNYSEEPDDDVTLASLVHRSGSSSKIKAPKIRSSSKKVDELCDVAEDIRSSSKKVDELGDMAEGTRTVLSRSRADHSVGRKRVRVILSDDESDENPEIVQFKRTSTSPADSMSISGTALISIAYSYVGMAKIYLLVVLTPHFCGQQIMEQTAAETR